MEGCLKQGALAGTVKSTSGSWTRIQWRHESLCYVWRSWCERNRTRAICTTLHDGILYGCYTDGPSVRCILKKHEICFVKQLSALLAGFRCFVGAFNLHFRPGLPKLGLGWVRCDNRHSPVHAGGTLRLIPRDDSLCSQAHCEPRVKVQFFVALACFAYQASNLGNLTNSLPVPLVAYFLSPLSLAFTDCYLVVYNLLCMHL